MRFIIFAVIAASIPALACSCVGEFSPCATVGGTNAVFLGKVIRDTGAEPWGDRNAILQVEEVFGGLSKDVKEIEVSTAAGTSCYIPMKEGERWVVMAGRSPRGGDTLTTGGCSGSFRADGADVIVDAIRRTLAGAPPSVVGSVYKRKGSYESDAAVPAGVRIVARQGERVRETRTIAGGQYEFKIIEPGAWKLQVESPGLVASEGYGRPETIVPPQRCAVQTLYATVDGRVRGSVRSRDGKPLAGIPVQVFTYDERQKEFSSRAFKQVVTGDDGQYAFAGLPPQNYILAVNGEKYRDTLAHPPAYYPGTRDRSAASVITLAELENRCCLDLVVESPRQAAKLIVEAVLEDGTSRPTAGLALYDTNGEQRAFTSAHSGKPDSLSVDVWIGETYRLVVRDFDIGKGVSGPDGSIRFAGGQDWEGSIDVLQIVAPEMNVRIVLKPKRR